MHERLLLQFSNSVTSFEQDTRFWLHTVTAGNVTWGKGRSSDVKIQNFGNLSFWFVSPPLVEGLLHHWYC